MTPAYLFFIDASYFIAGERERRRGNRKFDLVNGSCGWVMVLREVKVALEEEDDDMEKRG